MVERLVRNEEVRGSIPLGSTNPPADWIAPRKSITYTAVQISLGGSFTRSLGGSFFGYFMRLMAFSTIRSSLIAWRTILLEPKASPERRA